MSPTTVAGIDQRLFVVRAGPRTDPFARLVHQVHNDPANAYNLDGYLWVLEESAPEPCDECGQLFVPSFRYDGEPAQGQPRRYCSRRCGFRAAERRRPARRPRRTAA